MNAQEYEAELRRLLYSLPEQEREEAVAFYRESIADRIDDGLIEEEAVASMVSPAEAACAILANRAEAQESQTSKMDEVAAGVGEGVSGASGVSAVSGASEVPGGSGVSGVSGSSRVSGVSETSAASQQLMRQPAQQAPFWTRLKHGQLTPLEWVGVILSSVIWLPLLAAVFSVIVGALAVVFALYLCVWVLIACVWITGAALVIAAPANILHIIWGAQIGNIPYMLVNIGYSLVAFGGGIWVLRGALKLTKLFLKGHREVARAVRKKPVESEMPTSHSVLANPSSGTPASSGAFASSSPSTPTNPSEPVNFSTSAGTAAFLRFCLILMGVGFLSVVAGFLLSGFDWHIFLTTFTHDGYIYIGGMVVEHPEHLLFGRLYFAWLV